MAHKTGGKSHAEEIAQLVEQMTKNAQLKYIEVCDLLSKRINLDCDIDRFNRNFRGHDRSDNKYYDLNELIALIQVFREDVADHHRCTAAEAFALFNLTRVPLEEFKQLKALFSEKEYRAAWQPYLHTDVIPADLTKETSFIKPVYTHNVIGRDDDIATLQARLGVNHDRLQFPITVVRGWPGVGKTTVINRIVYDEKQLLRPLYPDGILWTTLGPNGNVLHALRNWARQLNIMQVEQMQKLEDVIEQMRYAFQGKRVLLVVDDVWNEKQGAVFRQLASDQTTFLFVTRFTELAITMGEIMSNVYFLDVLNSEASLKLLTLFAPHAAQAYPAKMLDLVNTLEGLPLALCVAGRLIEDEFIIGFDPSPLIEALQTNFGSFSGRERTERFDEATGQTPTIGLLFRKSVQTLGTTHQQIFACMGGFAPKPATFDLEAVAKICGLADPQGAARALVGRGLLEPLGGGRFQMHYTLRMYARHLLETNMKELDEPPQ